VVAAVDDDVAREGSTNAPVSQLP